MNAVPDARLRLAQNPREPVSIDIETDGGELRAAGVRGFGVAVGEDSWYFPLTHPGSYNLTVEQAKPVVEAVARHHVIVMHNSPFDRLGLWLVFGIDFKAHRVYDTQTRDHMISSTANHKLKEIGARLFGADAKAEAVALKELNRGRRVDEVYRELRDPVNMLPRAEREPAKVTRDRAREIAAASKKSWATYTADDIAAYCEQDCLLTLMVFEAQEEWLAEHPEVWEDEERRNRLTDLAYRMRRTGVAVDLERAYVELERAEAAAAALAEPWAHVNLKSPPQVAELLYDEWGLPCTERTKTGARSTKRVALEKLAYDPRVASLIEYRELTKQIDAFFVPLINRGARVYPSWSPDRTRTGRWACSEPNLMQTPREGSVRECLVPDPGYVFVHADLPSAELRIAAIISGEESWLETLAAGGDMHQLAADKGGFSRQAGKTMNYANLYGQGIKALAVKMAQLTGRQWPYSEAKRIWLAYWRGVPRVKRLFDGLGESWARRGRLQIKPWPVYRPYINGRTGFPEGKYLALNAVVQATIAQLVNDWLLALDGPVQALGGYIAAQVHDAVVLAVPEARVAEARALLQDTFDRINTDRFDTLAWPLDMEESF